MNNGLPVIGTWSGQGGATHFTPANLPAAIAAFRSPAFIVRDGLDGVVGVGVSGTFQAQQAMGYPCLGILPPLYPEWLGDRGFLEMHGLRFPYVAGAMARGIASETLVIELAHAGMLGFFGAGGLSPARVEQALATLTEALGDRLPWGCNLIHSPQEPALENIIVGLLLRYQVRRVEASAFMALTPAVVRYAFSGVTRNAAGQIQRINHVFAKISRPEVAQHFMAPPPQAMLDALVQTGELTADEAASGAASSKARIRSRRFPPHHWLIEDYYDPNPAAPDKTYGKTGAFLDAVPFDALGYGVPPNFVQQTNTSYRVISSCNSRQRFNKNCELRCL